MFNPKDLLILNKNFYANPKLMQYMLTHFSTLETIQHDIDSILALFPIKNKEKTKQQFLSTQIDKEYAFLQNENIQILTHLDASYPKQLQEIDDAPAILFYKGNIQCLAKTIISIIGPREPSEYGKKIATSFTKALSEHCCICSGFAVGIDYIAHKTTCDENHESIAVLGTDFSKVYPSHYHSLSKLILDNNGLIVSELPFFIETNPFHFRFRNRIISGLSKGVVICEATKKSGTLITAQCAIEQNREIFAIPGSIFSKQSEGTLSLIQQGAKCTLSPQDIYDELNLDFKSNPNLFETVNNKSHLDTSHLSDTEKTIVSLLNDPQTIDDIVTKSKLPLSQVLHTLTTLEIKNIIEQKPGKLFQINVSQK
jgi:DNA processing protein